MSSTSDIGANITPQKSKRSRISRLLRRADSSSSSVGATRSSEVSPERTDSKRATRVGAFFRHPGSSSSSLSVASDAENEDAAAKTKRSAMRRSLSALSSKARHGTSRRSSIDSEPLALDTRAVSPPLQVPAEHKMLSPVVESPMADSPGPHIFSPMLVVSQPQQDVPPESGEPVATPPAQSGAVDHPETSLPEAAPAVLTEDVSSPSPPVAAEQSGSTVSSEQSGEPIAREASTDESSVEAPRAPTLSNSSVMSDSDSAAAPWEMEYERLGWSKHELPGEAVYFTHPAKGIVSDVDLRREGTMREVFEFLAGPHISPLPGWELWLRDTGNMPARASDYCFVNHDLRLVSFTPEPSEPTAAGQALYWTYVEKHPAHCAHIVLSEKTVAEAHNALTCEGEKLLPSGNQIDIPIFTQDERQQYSTSLKSLSENPTLAEKTAGTRDVANILLRMNQWEQDQWHKLGGVDQPKPATADEPRVRAVPVPFSDDYTLGLKDVVMVAVAAGMVVGCAALLGPAAAFVMVLREIRRR